MAKSKPVSAAQQAPAKKVPAKRAAPSSKSSAKQAAPTKARAGTVKKSAAKPGDKGTAPATAPAKKASAKKAPAKKATPAKKAAPTKAAAAKQPASKKAAPAKKAAAAGRKASPFSAAFLRAQQESLLRERATYTRQAASLQAEADSLIADVEPGDVQFDEESGEGDTLSIERARDLTLSAQALAQVEEIDHALAKFDLGTYGICEVSGEPIPEERLDAIPWARQRVEFKIGGLGRR